MASLPLVTAQSRCWTGVLAATCGTKLDHGVLAVGNGTVSLLDRCAHSNVRYGSFTTWRPCRWPQHSFARSRQVCSQQRAVRFFTVAFLPLATAQFCSLKTSVLTATCGAVALPWRSCRGLTAQFCRSRQVRSQQRTVMDSFTVAFLPFANGTILLAQDRCSHSNVRYSSFSVAPLPLATGTDLSLKDRCAHSNVRYSSFTVASLAVGHGTVLSLKTGVLTATCGTAALPWRPCRWLTAEFSSLKTGVLTETCGAIALPWRPCRWLTAQFWPLKTGVLTETCGTIALPWRPCRWQRHSFVAQDRCAHRNVRYDSFTVAPLPLANGTVVSLQGRCAHCNVRYSSFTVAPLPLANGTVSLAQDRCAHSNVRNG